KRAGLSRVERHMLSKPAVLPFEDATLAVAHEADDAVVAQLLSALRNHQRSVVFCGSGQLAGMVADAFRAYSSKIPVFEHTVAAQADQIDEDLRNWRSTGGVIVADETAEDGVNLQQADAVVHFRLPWSPNRLEQRIGRIDRYSSFFDSVNKPAQHFVLALGDTDHSFSAAWSDLLVHAFEAWTTSMSAIQDRLDELEVQLWTRGVHHGPQTMHGARGDVTSAITAERKQIQVMDALDAVADSSLGEKIAVRIGKSETRWQAYERDARRYVAPDSGGIRFTVTEPGSPVEFGVDTIRKPLISPLLLAQQFGRLPAGSTRGVFNRTVALRNPGLRLFRLGNPFVSGLENVINVDERGQASAMLRRLRTAEPLSFFGFDLLVEADLTQAVAHLGSAGNLALRRYADALFPPSLARVWLQAGTDEFVRDPKLVSWLERAYDNRRDENLGGQFGILADVFGGLDRFAQQVRTAEKTSVEAFANEAALRTRACRAQDEAQQLLTIYRAQAESRQAAGRLITDAESYLLDVEVREAVVNALAAPAIRVMAASCVVGGQWTNG
ncbi:MAG: SWF/SNF helicase family protein, partial [Actinomycetia bacterium]|nr:SWF/SNF helicase family protein [Actinomycetes bacterium]